MIVSYIAGDDTWVYLYEPKRKVDNRIWALKHAKRPSIAKRTLTAKNVLCTVFFRNSGQLMQSAVPKATTPQSKYYKEEAKRTAIQNKNFTRTYMQKV